MSKNLPAKISCETKIAYEAQDQAKAAAATLYYQKGTKLKVYKCRDCGLWHLSSSFNT